jgi:fumarate reductase flavoprotein subunit
MDLDRRSFLKGAVASGTLMAAAGLAGCAPSEPQEPSSDGNSVADNGGDAPQPVQYDVSEIIECDVVIVGSGSSGCCAAMEAADQGLNTVFIEKQGVLGGMEFGTEGAFGLGSTMQVEAGVKLPELNELINEEMVFANYLVDPLVWRDMLSHSGENIDWLIDHGQIFESVGSYLGASSFECYHRWVGGTGIDFGPTVTSYLAGKGNVTVLTETEYVDFVVEGNKVCGIYANDASGKTFQINAQSTIMCTGGFAENKELVSEALGYDVTATTTLSGPADGLAREKMITLGADAGTPVALINVISVAGHLAEEEISVATGYQAILVINQDGERFMNEDLYTKYLFALTWNSYNSQKHTYVFFDENAIKRLETEGILGDFLSWSAGDALLNLRQQLDDDAASGLGYVIKGESIEDIASAIGAQPATLRATIERYNGFCSSGQDPDFGCNPAFLHEIGDGPYYAVAPSLFYTTTIGGLRIDRRQRVIDLEGNVIPGLYSAGVESSMLYRETYNYALSGGMNAYCFYSGRNAVQSAIQDN